MTTIIHLDLLQLSFSTNSFDENTVSNFLIQQIKPSKGFNKTFTIYRYDNGLKFLIGYINIGLLEHTNYSYIHFDNKTLYRNDFQFILNDFLHSFNLLFVRVRKIDLCINTNKNLLMSYYDNFDNIEKTLLKDYIMDSYQRDDSHIINSFNDILKGKLPNKEIKELIKKDINSKTKYIHSNKYSFNRNINKDFDSGQPRKRFMRIENKSNEIKESNKKYILDHYKNCLDIDQPIYRMELCLTFENSLKKTTSKWINNTFNILTDKKYNELPEYSKREYTKQNIDNSIIIDLTKLTDEIYLYSIFNYFKVADISSLIDIDKILLKNNDNTRIFKRESQTAIIKSISQSNKITDNTFDTIIDIENKNRLKSYYRNQISILENENDFIDLFDFENTF
jgi:hypothetical protein